MIPEFPNFKQLEITDKQEIEKLVSSFPPYSDFNFISLFAWNTEDKTVISLLNGNLVVRMNDYITEEPMYTFIGINEVVDTTEKIIEFAKNNGLQPQLKLIPEVVINSNSELNKRFKATEDRDNFDYIFSIPELAEMEGGDYAVKRNFVNRFKKSYSSSYRELNIDNEKTKEDLIEVLMAWSESRDKTEDETDVEFEAIQKVLEFGSELELLILGLFIDEKMVGFSINDLGVEGYATNLFEKADIDYQGIFQYLRYITCRVLDEKGYKFLNFEQDLGIEGLRKSKLSYNPKFFLKKYTVY